MGGVVVKRCFAVTFLLVCLMLIGCGMSDKKKDEVIFDLLLSGQIEEAKTKVVEYYFMEGDEDKAIAWYIIIEEEEKKIGSKASASKLESFMKEFNVKLTAKDVQYDMPNNLDKEFAVEGTAKLSTYYNYGFRDMEKDYFVVSLRPTGGAYSDEWYLYLHRESFKALFDKLKDSDVTIIVVAEIPKWVYKDNQGNMAFVSRVRW